MVLAATGNVASRLVGMVAAPLDPRQPRSDRGSGLRVNILRFADGLSKFTNPRAVARLIEGTIK